MYHIMVEYQFLMLSDIRFQWIQSSTPPSYCWIWPGLQTWLIPSRLPLRPSQILSVNMYVPFIYIYFLSLLRLERFVNNYIKFFSNFVSIYIYRYFDIKLLFYSSKLIKSRFVLYCIYVLPLLRVYQLRWKCQSISDLSILNCIIK